jgi:hypothetical protein
MKSNALAIPMARAAATAFAADVGAVDKANVPYATAPMEAALRRLGNPVKLRDLRSAEVRKRTDKELYTWTSDGMGKMPAYRGKLTEAELNAVAAHLRNDGEK